MNGAWKTGTWENTATSVTYSLGDQIEAGTKFTFTVGAQKTGVSPSVDSNPVTITWGALEAPQDLQVITATRQTVSLGWAPVPGATYYDVDMDDNFLGSSENNRYVASGLTEGKSYSFAVIAKNELWESSMGAAITAVPGSDYTLVSYYTGWSVHDRKFYPEDVAVSKITHINYAFADLCWKKFGSGGAECQNEDLPLQEDYVFDGEIIVGDPEVDIDNFAVFSVIRDEHPNLKLMVSVGGWSWSKNFSNMAADEITRRSFANSVVKFLRQYELDGIDIDWEYPVEGGDDSNSRRPEDKQNFTLMMAALRDALDAAGSVDGKYYLLTMASGQGDNFVVNADFANSSAYLDFINIMTYDYSGKWDELANHNSPLFYDKKLPTSSAPRNNVRGGLLGHLNGGVPNYKLVVGVPFYGKGWEGCPAGGEYQTCSKSSTSFGTWETGIFDFTDLDHNYVNKNGYERHWNDAAKVAYLYNADKQIFMTYNDENTMLYTASLVKTLDIAGTMNWEISGDRDKKLIAALNSALPIDGKVNTQELAAPSQPKVASTSTKSIKVTWDAVAGANAYEVYVNDQFAGYSDTTSYTVGD
ncbi:glycosyl hydrolase family 18 protein [Paenibacillus sp. D2_2]|uniref:glycoside hydrolase family 18 protein n=1 Tax=Paenibacillus sp. D2_2 TaxID=3073092 RepID=UPI00281557D0|nr:glycosyl hydrolase family 18 protein [Paenibacillus sp. D2_2]WMT40165.1 glycosyl hydrolase family 18 protein [Paenibacillus sp. D2_2]